MYESDAFNNPLEHDQTYSEQYNGGGFENFGQQQNPNHTFTGYNLDYSQLGFDQQQK